MFLRYGLNIYFRLRGYIKCKMIILCVYFIIYNNFLMISLKKVCNCCLVIGKYLKLGD